MSRVPTKKVRAPSPFRKAATQPAITRIAVSQSLIDNWDFLLIGANTKFPWRSYVSAIDPTSADPGVLIRGSQNSYKTLKGTIAARPGLKRRGVADTTLSGVKSSWEWYTSLGFVRPLRVTAAGKWQVEFDAADGNGPLWYDLITGLTLTRFVFDAYWDTTYKKDCLLAVKGDTVIHRWGGGMGVVSSVSNAVGFIATIDQPYATPNHDSGGTGYKVGDLLTIAGGGGATIYVDAVSPGGAATIAIKTGGSGYLVNDLVTVQRTNSNAHATFKVLTVDGSGAITSLVIISAGSGYTADPNVNLTCSGGAGTLAVVNVLTIGDTITAWHVKVNTSGYAGANLIATTGGTGVGATVSITAVADFSITLGGNKSIAALGFEGTKQISINNTTYSFTSSNLNGGQSFVGINVDPSAIPIGSIVLQLVETQTNIPGNAPATFTNDFIKVINNQLHVGSYNSRFVYVSSNTDFTSFAVPGTRTLGTPDLLTLDSNVRGITVQKGSAGQSTNAGNAVISGGLGDWYTIVRTQITVGSSLQENVTVIKSESADLATALAHEFITNVGDNIIFLDQNNQLREFGTARNITNPVFPLLSLDVYTELQETNFTGGHLRAVADENGETIYVVAPLTGVDFMYQIRQRLDAVGNVTAERLWQPPQIRGLSRIAVISGVTFGHSTANPQIYQLWDTGQWHDDSPSNEVLPYEVHIIPAYMNIGYTQQLFFDKLFVEGFMTGGSIVSCNIMMEYQGAKNIPTIVINDPSKGQKTAKLFTGLSPNALGDNPLGFQPLGDGMPVMGGADALVPKFRCIRTVTPSYVFEYALDFWSAAADSQWELERIGVNQTAVPSRPVAIRS